MQWTLTSPHLYAYIYQRETQGSSVLLGTSRLSPNSIYVLFLDFTWLIHGLYMALYGYVYIYIYGFYISYRWFIDDLYGL